MRDLKSWKPIKVKSPKAIKKPGLVVVDEYPSQLEEVFELRHPHTRFQKYTSQELKDFVTKLTKGKSLKNHGSWFYFPWRNEVVHYLPENLHQELRTARNRFLITEEEQKKYYHSTIGIFGMSVGSHVALTITMTGGAKNIKLADLDTISGSNLNRIRAGFSSLGINKAIFIARQIYEINPYANIKLYPNGISDKNIHEFITGTPKLNLLIEEMDQPYFKIKARYIARAAGIPVIMAADNGDGIITDIERYDLNKKYPILHGILGKMTPEDFKKIEPKDLPKTIAKMAGATIANVRMLESVIQVGRKIYSWPQLGTAATMCGTILAYLARGVVNKNPNLKSGRYEVNPESIFDASYKNPIEIKKRNATRKKILKIIGLTKP